MLRSFLSHRVVLIGTISLKKFPKSLAVSYPHLYPILRFLPALPHPLLSFSDRNHDPITRKQYLVFSDRLSLCRCFVEPFNGRDDPK